MALATPEINVTGWANALNQMSALFNSITTNSGDLQYQNINDIQRLRVDVERGIAGLQADAAINGALVQASVADRGGPATNAATLSGHNALMTALDAWEAAVISAARAPAKNQIVVVVSNTLGDQILKQIVLASAIPAAFADPLRAGQEAADVITALGALGA